MNFTNDLPKIVEQLEACGYECQAGPLKNNIAFQELQRMAALPGIYDRNTIIEYIDTSIRFWRSNRLVHELTIQDYYIDAFQSIRNIVAGEILSQDAGDIPDAKPTVRIIGKGQAHTLEDDFQHFLAYSSLSNESAESIEKLRKAYGAAWDPSFTRMNQDTVCIDGKFYRVMSDEEHADFVWGNDRPASPALDVTPESH